MLHVGIIGGKSLEKINELINNHFDNVTTHPFSSIVEFHNSSSLRELKVDRLLIFQDGVNDVNSARLSALSAYLSKTYPSTKIVVVLKSKELADQFYEVFNTPLSVIIVIKSIKTNTILSFVDGRIDDIKKEIGYTPSSYVDKQDILEEVVSIEDLKGNVPNPNPSATPTPEIPIPPVDTPPVGDTPPKKEGLFGKLSLGKGKKEKKKKEKKGSMFAWGKKKKKEGSEEEEEKREYKPVDMGTPLQPKPPEEAEEIEPPLQEEEEEEVDFSIYGVEEGEEPPTEVVTNEEEPEEDLSDTDFSDFEGMEEFEEEIEETPEEDPEEEEEELDLEDLSEQFSGLSMADDDEDENLEEDENSEGSLIEKVKGEAPKVDFEVPELAQGVELKAPEIEEVDDEDDEPILIEKEVGSGLSVNVEDDDDSEEIDIGSEDEQDNIIDKQEKHRKLQEIKDNMFSKGVEYVTPSPKAGVVPIPAIELEDVQDDNDDFMGDLDDMNDRFAQRDVKIVERVVEKVVNVSGGKRKYRNGIRTIIFTGDRKTGVTRTALNSAKYFAKDSNTLYVDFDIERHGSLLYMGLEDIAIEPDRVQNGLATVKNITTLPNIVFNYAKGGFDALISSYGEEFSDTQIANIQRVLLAQREYSTIIIDCPMEFLHLLDDMIVYSEIIICAESTLPSVLNSLLGVSSLSDNDKVQSSLFNNSQFLLTHNIDLPSFRKSMSYVENLFSLDEQDYNWGKLPVIGSTKGMVDVLEKF